MSATATAARTNGNDFSHDPPIGGAIPEPSEQLPDAPVKIYKADGHTYKHPTMTQKAQSWIQQNIVTIILVVITFVTTFAYMKFQIDNVLEKNAELKTQGEKDRLALEKMISENKGETNKAVADAQAYAVSARGKADFLAGYLLGRGLIRQEDIPQQFR